MIATPFRWHDGERVIAFGPLADALSLLEHGYTLLTTQRASAAAAGLDPAATHFVPSGRVDEVAAELRPHVKGELLVALGGGRVIDVAKALVAADPPRRVAAIPTTLSGAEMTAGHRHVAGLASETPHVRPAIVINDPALCASQPLPRLAASACNALGHAFEGPMTKLRNPVCEAAAREAISLIDGALPATGDGGLEPDRPALALGALLAGYVIGSTGSGLHHVMCQTLARFAGVGHGPANAIMLPYTLGALLVRFPEEMRRLGCADPIALAARVCALTGATRLRDVGVSQSDGTLEQCAVEAAKRPELRMTPPAPDVDELRDLYGAAW
jgi:alcohol dehydrogenase class IV